MHIALIFHITHDFYSCSANNECIDMHIFVSGLFFPDTSSFLKPAHLVVKIFLQLRFLTLKGTFAFCSATRSSVFVLCSLFFVFILELFSWPLLWQDSASFSPTRVIFSYFRICSVSSQPWWSPAWRPTADSFSPLQVSSNDSSPILSIIASNETSPSSLYLDASEPSRVEIL